MTLFAILLDRINHFCWSIASAPANSSGRRRYSIEKRLSISGSAAAGGFRRRRRRRL